MKKVGITSAKVHIEFDYYLKGSVMKGTVENGVTEVRSHFEVESDEQDESVIDIIKLAKQGCFAESLVQTAVPIQSTFRFNGKVVRIDD